MDDPLVAVSRGAVAQPELEAVVRSNPVERVVAAAFDDHQREIMTFASHAMRDRDAAEDVVQESFLRLVREVQAGRTPDNLRAWLYRVAANLIVERSRRRAAAMRYLARLGRPPASEAPEAEWIRQEDAQGVRIALQAVAPEARVALVLAARGWSGSDIATAIGRSEGATRSLLCRARQRLRATLARDAQPDSFHPTGDER